MPSSQEVDLEERTYALHYRDERQEALERSGKSVSLPVPPLTIDIDPPAGGAKPEQTLATAWDTSSVGGVYIRQIGVIDVPRAGRYTVRVASKTTGGTVCIGELPTTSAHIFVRSFGVFALFTLVAVVLGQVLGRRAAARPQ